MLCLGYTYMVKGVASWVTHHYITAEGTHWDKISRKKSHAVPECNSRHGYSWVLKSCHILDRGTLTILTIFLQQNSPLLPPRVRTLVLAVVQILLTFEFGHVLWLITWRLLIFSLPLRDEESVNLRGSNPWPSRGFRLRSGQYMRNLVLGMSTFNTGQRKQETLEARLLPHVDLCD